MKAPFHTDRLVIRDLSVNDNLFVLELVNSPGWLQFIGDRQVHSPEGATAYIQKILADPSITYWVVRLRTIEVPIGVISYVQRTYLEHPDIGFAFLPTANGQGYAYEASREMLRQLLTTTDHSQILATTLPGNERSIKLLEKLGLQFQREIEVDMEQLRVYSTTIA